MIEQRAFLLSTGLSALAVFLVYQYISGEEAVLEKSFGLGTSQKMVVAARDILQFESIRPTDIEVISPVPASQAPPGLISDPRDVIDAVAAVPILKGEHILDNKILSKNIYSGLDKQIASGRRAISIPVTLKSSLGYMLRPGNRIDLAAKFEYKAGGISINEVKVFMQDMLVLASGRTIQANAPKAVDQNVVREIMREFKKDTPQDRSEIQETLNLAKTDTTYQTVTLEVTPVQAQQIVYVMTAFGEIDVLLRHSDDRALARTGTTNFFDVMGNDSYYVRGPKAPMRAIPKPPRFIDTIGGETVPRSN